MDVRFDDLPALAALVSDRFGEPSLPLIVTQEMIDRFAELTGDRQWIHVDVERARREGPLRSLGSSPDGSSRRGTIAHGLLLIGLLPSLAPDRPRIIGYGSAIHYGFDQVRFLSPVPAGSAVTARRRIAHVRKKGVGGTQITFESEIAIPGAARPAVACRSIALFLP